MIDFPTTSLGMIQGLKAQSLDDWYKFYVRYYPGLCAWCRRKSLDSERSEDLVQDLVSTVLGRIGTFEHNGRPKAFRLWLLTILKHKRIDLHRKWQVELTDGDLDDLLLPAEHEDQETVRLRVQLAIAALGTSFEPRTIEAFLRHCMYGESLVSVAEALKLTPAGVRTAVSRCKRRMRELLGDFYGQAGLGS